MKSIAAAALCLLAGCVIQTPNIRSLGDSTYLATGGSHRNCQAARQDADGQAAEQCNKPNAEVASLGYTDKQVPHGCVAELKFQCVSPETLDQMLHKYLGRNIAQVIDQLGYPDRQDVVLGEKVYYFIHQTCTVKIGTDGSNIIKGASSDGRCGHYVERLR